MGYDMLPKYLDNTLRFFVERGCNCPMKAWYTREKTLSEECKEEIKKWYDFTEFGNKRCSITKANETYNLIGKFNIEINFKIFVNNMNATAEFHLHKNKKCIRMYVYADKIDFVKSEINGNWSTSKINIMPNENIMNQGMTIHIKIRIFKFYCEFNIGNGTKTFTNKFWYTNWWNGNNCVKFKNLRIKGDFIRLNAIMETTNTQMSKIETPHSNRIYNNFMTENSKVTIRGKINKNAEKLQILLLHDAPEFDLNIGATVLSIDVYYNKDLISFMTSYYGGKYKSNETMERASQVFTRGMYFQCEIVMQSVMAYSFFTIHNNGKENWRYEGSFPFWAINWIQVNGDVVLLEEPFITSPKQQKSEIQKFKHELKKLPFYGSSVCLEGTIFSSRSVKGKVHFEINLMHESNEDHPEVGDIILKIEFFFSPTYNETFIEMSNRFFGGSMINIKKFSNPIGQPGVKFTVRIYVTKKAFEIQINNGKDYVSFDHVAPPWMVNWITVKGYVKDVHFDKEAKRCQIIKGMPLPPFITQIDPEKPLKEGNYISIKGKLMEMNENVEINFYHESLGWNKTGLEGKIVLQADIDKNGKEVSFCSRIKGVMNCSSAIKLEPSLKTDNEFKMIFLITKECYEIYYDNEVIATYKHQIPVWAIQYIVVTGPITTIEGKTFAEIDKHY
ncbi:hypothetical protein ACQ4LE_000615 [Meloidogyne hapla]